MLLTYGFLTRSSHSSSLGLLKSVEQLTELRETVYTLHHWFVIKDRCETCLGWGLERGCGAPMPPRVHSPHISTCSPTQSSPAPPFWVFMGVSWQGCDR